MVAGDVVDALPDAFHHGVDGHDHDEDEDDDDDDDPDLTL